MPESSLSHVSEYHQRQNPKKKTAQGMKAKSNESQDFYGGVARTRGQSMQAKYYSMQVLCHWWIHSDSRQINP